MAFSRQEYWGGLPYPPPGDFPDPGIAFLMFPVLANGILTTSATWEAPQTELSLYEEPFVFSTCFFFFFTAKFHNLALDSGVIPQAYPVNAAVINSLIHV